MNYKNFLIILLAITFILGCDVSMVEKQPLYTDEEIANSKFAFDTDNEDCILYALYLDKYWSSSEIDELAALPSGISVFCECGSCADVSAYQSLLVKLLEKQITIESKLDRYLQFHDESKKTETFKVDREDEASVRSAQYLTKHFSQSEMIALARLPYGLDANLDSDKGSTEIVYSTIAKLLTKTVHIERKVDSLMTSPTIGVDPIEIIREYLKTHSIDSLITE